MRKGVIIGFVLGVIILLIVGLLFTKTSIKKLNELVTEKITKQSLGSLCSGEEECKEFCLNNRGQCENYCQGNKNELCRTIFPIEKPTTDNIDLITNEETEDCSSDIIFTHYLVDPKFVYSVSQIGSVGGANSEIIGRSYIAVKDEFTNQKVPIYAPTDMTLAYASYYSSPNHIEGLLPDYGLAFEIKCGKRMSLAHVKEVIPQIKDKLPTTPQNKSAYNYPINIEFKAGDLIGYYIKGPGSVAFDFIVDDSKIKNKFANQERYEAGHGHNTLHSICPYDLYSGEMKEAYYNLLPGIECGTMERDKIGTIAGQWFLNLDPNTGMGDYKKDGDYGNPLPIAMTPERISIGHVGTDNIIWIYPNNPTHKDPKEIMTEYCYQNYPTTPDNAQGYVYFKIVDNMTMDVYYSEIGNCPSSFPTTGVKRYYR